MRSPRQRGAPGLGWWYARAPSRLPSLRDRGRCPHRRAHGGKKKQRGRGGHDGSAVCGGGRTTSLARAAAMDRRSRLAAISTPSAAPASRAPPRGWHDFTVLIAVSGRNVRSARLSIILWARERWGAASRWASGPACPALMV